MPKSEKDMSMSIYPSPNKGSNNDAKVTIRLTTTTAATQRNL